jgi:transposase
MRRAVKIVLSDDDRQTLSKWARGRSTPARLVLRAKIVLAAADGKLNCDIAAELGTGMKTVCQWRNRFAKAGLAGIEKDAPRGGRPATKQAALAAEIIRKTTAEKPRAATHWSVRTLAAEMGISRSLVHRVWRANRLQPHRTKTFKLSNDPRFAEKLVDVVGLYINPPEHALVICADEKSQIQALDRTQKGLPIHPGRLGTMTHDYKRHGTTTLFAALLVEDGLVIEKCMPRHRHQEWIKFLKHIDASTDPTRELHLIIDNYATHKHPNAALAGAASSVSHSFHADELFLAEYGRALVWRADAEALAAGNVSQCERPSGGDRGVCRRTQRTGQRPPVDSAARSHPRQSQTRPRRPR